MTVENKIRFYRKHSPIIDEWMTTNNFNERLLSEKILQNLESLDTLFNGYTNMPEEVRVEFEREDILKKFIEWQQRENEGKYKPVRRKIR